MNLIFRSFLHALGVVAYVSLLVFGISHGEALFGKEENLLIPLFMLLLFVVSASVTGFLVLEKPIRLYLGGDYRGAITFLFSTLAWLIVALTAILVVYRLSL
jgi:hypothetical protein